MSSTVSKYLIKLVEITQDNHIVGKIWEKLATHFPSPPLFIGPAEPNFLRVRGALSMIAAEERIFRKNNVLPVDPFTWILLIILILGLIQ